VREEVSQLEQFLTVPELCALLSIPRSTYYEWRRKRIGLRTIKSPNGGTRIRVTDLEEWLRDREDSVA
jgi:excisionase family DNA binding protein